MRLHTFSWRKAWQCATCRNAIRKTSWVTTEVICTYFAISLPIYRRQSFTCPLEFINGRPARGSNPSQSIRSYGSNVKARLDGKEHQWLQTATPSTVSMMKFSLKSSLHLASLGKRVVQSLSDSITRLVGKTRREWALTTKDDWSSPTQSNTTITCKMI